MPKKVNNIDCECIINKKGKGKNTKLVSKRCVCIIEGEIVNSDRLRVKETQFDPDD